MISNFSRLRYLNPVMWDRVSKLILHESCDDKFLRKFEEALRAVSITKSREKFESILKEIETRVCKFSKYNMKVQNIPEKGILRDTNTETKIGYQNMRDTFGQFGNVKDLMMAKGTAYVQFSNKSDSIKTCKLINNMKMGNNIIKAEII
jgi:RNA recognition motif-containing protein